MKLLYRLRKTIRFLKEPQELNKIRRSGLFDEQWYLENNPDVVQAKVEPALHYLRYGGIEGRDPGPDFSSRFYLDTYEDVKKAGINPLVHYLRYGLKEGRNTHPNRTDTIKSYIKGKSTRPPDFLIGGAQKAGTTALYTYLSTHPEIAATSEKEHHFFNCEKNYAKGMAFYQSLFPITSEHQLTFDASSGYLADAKSPARIHDYNPNIKIIFLLRDPVDRAYSAWQMYKSNYEVNINWFYDDWISFCNNGTVNPKRRSADSLSHFHSFIEEEMDCEEHGIAIEANVLNSGFYAIQLERYFDIFNRDQIMIIHNEKLRLQTRETLNNIQDFIGVKSYAYEPKSLNPVFVGNYIESMESRTRLLLNDYYKPHNELLFSLLGKQDAWW